MRAAYVCSNVAGSPPRQGSLTERLKSSWRTDTPSKNDLMNVPASVSAKRSSTTSVVLFTASLAMYNVVCSKMMR